jgi:23S rRNA (adenine-N6)-dimethyltransferase
VSERRAQRARLPDRAPSQHFLHSQDAAELVRGAGLRRTDLVVDLGAGTGRLTAELARVADRVIAVELDRSLARGLRGRWANVDVLRADAATVALPRRDFRVVANLPFDGTNAILRHLLDDPRVPLVRADVVVQWGVAVKRGLPWPSTASGVLWGARYAMSVERRLPPAAFDPPPSVDAGVLVIERRAAPLVPAAGWPNYRRFVAHGFRHGLRTVVPPRTFRRLRLAGVQPRELDAHKWAALFRATRQ